MKDNPTPPLILDARTVLEAISASLAFVVAGIAAVDLPNPYDVLAPLIVGAIIVLISRLLGKSYTQTVDALTVTLNKVMTERTILQGDATQATLKKAEEAVVALETPKTPKL